MVYCDLNDFGWMDLKVYLYVSFYRAPYGANNSTIYALFQTQTSLILDKVFQQNMINKGDLHSDPVSL